MTLPASHCVLYTFARPLLLDGYALINGFLEQVFQPLQLADDFVAIADVGIATLGLSACPFRRRLTGARSCCG